MHSLVGGKNDGVWKLLIFVVIVILLDSEVGLLFVH
jgi:hypothetical protein